MRSSGLVKPPDADAPRFGPSRRRDIELELGARGRAPELRSASRKANARCDRTASSEVVLLDDWRAPDDVPAARSIRRRLGPPLGESVRGRSIASRVLAGNRGFREITGARVVTGADGGFVYRVPPGASRQVRVAYLACSRDPAFAAQRLFSLRTRAGIRLTVTPSRVHNGRARDVPRAPARRPEAARRRARSSCRRASRAAASAPVADGPHRAQGRALPDPLPLQPHDPHDGLPLPRARPQADRLRLQHRLLAGAAS